LTIRFPATLHLREIDVPCARARGFLV